MTGDLMGRLTFTEYFHLLLAGEEPTEEQRFFLDLLLVSIAEHGMMPTNVAARMTLAADPDSLQGAVAAGILGAGSVVLGTSEECARLLEELQASGAIRRMRCRTPRCGRQGAGLRPSGSSPARSSGRTDSRARGRPRRERPARRARAIARRGPRRDTRQAADDERRPANRGDARPGLSVARCRRADPRAHRRPPRAPRRGGRAADRLPPGPCRRGGGRGTSTEVETRPWDEQLALDDESYGAQIAYLLEHSPFYREVGSSVSDRLVDIAHLPLTAKEELRESVTPECPFGAHFCADPSELVRIYSTSGTTGAPSYIPLTAGDLDNWVTASARSYAARGSQPASASSRPTTQALRRRCRARRLRATRADPHPRRHREHRAAGARDRAAPTRGRSS